MSPGGSILIPILAWLFVATPLHLYGQTIAAGSTLGVRLDREVTTKSAVAGEAITARIPQTLKTGSAVVAPAGSVLHGYVDFVQRKSETENGWMRLLFTRVELPNGRSVATLATGSFSIAEAKSKAKGVAVIAGLAGAGIVLGGRSYGVAAGLGGALVGLILFDNRHRYGRDLTLRAGSVIHLRLGGDLSVPVQ